MLELSYEGLAAADMWRAAGIRTPAYEPKAVAEKTARDPVWVHFGAGNIFRAYVAAMQDRLLNAGLADKGIIAVETFDPDIIDRIYKPYDNLSIVVTLAPEAAEGSGRGTNVKMVTGNMRDDDGSGAAGGRSAGDMGSDAGNGTIDRQSMGNMGSDAGNGTIIGSVSAAYATERDGDYNKLVGAFRNPGLQLVSYTVTEKAYALRGAGGAYLPDAAKDMEDGPRRPKNIMAITAAMLLERYKAGGRPIALVSMDNCSQNGERLRAAVLEIAAAWAERGFCGGGFMRWLDDQAQVAFPWSMIDKITPWPSPAVARRLAGADVCGMDVQTTAKGIVSAAFVNTEPTEYLVIEDNFPNGRPPLENAGVIFADRETVNRAEKMKVSTCLNPLHTTLAIFGFLLGYDSIAAEMKDPALLALTRRVAYDEGLPVAVNPGVIKPRDFLDEAINTRLPNPMIPDAPPRIAADTSQKIPVRFGETIRSYMEMAEKKYNETGINSFEMSLDKLIGIPLVLAGWLRYLLGFDDSLKSYTPGPDPMLELLCSLLKPIKYIIYEKDKNIINYNCEADSNNLINDSLKPILSNKKIFGVDLYKAGIAETIIEMFIKMNAGAGSVRRTLNEYLFQEIAPK